MPKTNKLRNFLKKQAKLSKKVPVVIVDEQATLQAKLEEEINIKTKTIQHLSKQSIEEQQMKNPIKSNLDRYDRMLKTKQQEINELDNELEKLTMKDWEEVNSSQLQNITEEENFVTADNNVIEEDFVIVNNNHSIETPFEFINEETNSEDDWEMVDTSSISANTL